MNHLNSNRMDDCAYPNELAGTKYRVAEARLAIASCPEIPEGAIVTLEKNDKSSCPFFELPCGTTTDLLWRRLERIEGPR